MLIGLTGRAQAGKDTVYQAMRDYLAGHIEVERRAFADPLYESAAAALGVTAEDLRRWKTDEDMEIGVIDDCTPVYERTITVREYLQRYGTEAHRDIFGKDFWVRALDLGDHRDKIVVVTDVRFPNEAQAIHDNGGYVVRVVGPYMGDDDHASELPLADSLVDAVIDNTHRGPDGLDRLRREIGHVYRCLRVVPA